MRRAALTFITAALLALPAVAAPRTRMPERAGADWALCLAAIRATERAVHTPDKLLEAIGLVESGRSAPAAPGVVPWPWTVDVSGQGHFYDSKADAVAAVQALLAGGTRSIDVGCMQVNLQQHPEAFASLEAAFDPQANVAYAARFLGQLYRRTGNWPQAAAAYHSQTPELAAEYERRVMAVWPLAPLFALPVASRPAVVSAIYTPEFARRLAQDAADRAARDAAFGPLRTTGRSAFLSQPAGGYTPEFAAERAQAAAERAARLAAMRWQPARVERRRGARQAAAQPRGARPSERAVAQALN